MRGIGPLRMTVRDRKRPEVTKSRDLFPVLFPRTFLVFIFFAQPEVGDFSLLESLFPVHFQICFCFFIFFKNISIFFSFHFFFIFFPFFDISLIISDIFFKQHFQQVTTQNYVQWSSLPRDFLRAWWLINCSFLLYFSWTFYL